MTLPHSPLQNQLLAALPAQELARISARLELVPMPLGEMLHEPGSRQQHGYFPTTSIVSLHYVMESGNSAQSAGVGNEGVVGMALFMGGGSTSGSAVVQTAGHAYRLESRLLKDLTGSAILQRVLLRYTQALIAQTMQTAACNRHHAVEQQVCRWLLQTLDRVSSSTLVITQELLAGILGVRREGISEVAQSLQSAGMIVYRRGHISVLSRAGLESRTCECYSVVKDELERLRADIRRPEVSKV